MENEASRCAYKDARYNPWKKTAKDCQFNFAQSVLSMGIRAGGGLYQICIQYRYQPENDQIWHTGMIH